MSKRVIELLAKPFWNKKPVVSRVELDNCEKPVKKTPAPLPPKTVAEEPRHSPKQGDSVSEPQSVGSGEAKAETKSEEKIKPEKTISSAPYDNFKNRLRKLQDLGTKSPREKMELKKILMPNNYVVPKKK
ncbi:uncharacterized protein LOC119661931 [Teleopsis dalmanni]|uniref:uncharacterized protein LOC119661931 n=1 Tax=Teleopsis dalmanni TaxID=139649 RepID=UPI0018CD54AA|nr:uncharacterized protein LOC119661931 [Teleopsis dalmanni]